MKRIAHLLFLGLALAPEAGCDEPNDDTWQWQLPAGFPAPKVPADNPMSKSKVALGRALFHDPRLSANGTQSCASCHQQELAFSDGKPRGIGSTGQVHPRGSMGLSNVAYNGTLTWANPALATLEQQIPLPLFGETPIELGATGHETEILARLRADARYGKLFPAAFAGVADPYSFPNMVAAIASFSRTLISGDSPYDRYTFQGEKTALSESALRGLNMFFTERLECFHCHSGFNFSSSTTHENTVFEERAFHNTGLFNIGGTGDFPPDNQGLYAFTGNRADMGKFRAPTLRNIELSAPYMHDGSIATLDGVLDHYGAGGRLIESGPNAGDGRANPFKSRFLVGFTLTPQERADMLAFLRSLTDPAFIANPKFSDPFAPR